MDEMLRRATLLAACALACAPPAALASPDLLDGVGSKATPGSPCSGRIAYRSVPDPANALQMSVEHELLLTCSSSAIALQGLSELHYDLDLDTTNGFDRATCGPTTLHCHAIRRSPPQLLALPLRHHVRFTMHRTDGSAWTGDSSICTGEGTPTLTCQHDQTLLVGGSGSETFG